MSRMKKPISRGQRTGGTSRAGLGQPTPPDTAGASDIRRPKPSKPAASRTSGSTGDGFGDRPIETTPKGIAGRAPIFRRRHL